MKKLLKYMKSYIKECILGPLFKLFEATLELIVPLVIASVIDGGIASGDKSYVVMMCLVLVLLGVVGLLASATAQYYAAKASVGFAKKIRHVLFSHIQHLGYSEIDTLGTSTMITRMTSDINQIQNGVNLTLRLFLRSPFVVFGAMIMAFTIDFKAALVFVGVIPLLSVVVFGIMLVCIPLYKRVQKNLDAVVLKTRENVWCSCHKSFLPRGRRGRRLCPAKRQAHLRVRICRQDICHHEPSYLCHHQYSHSSAHPCGCNKGVSWHNNPRRSSCFV